MNLELFLAFTLISFVLVFLGYYSKPEIKILAVLGFATLFFLGMLLQFNGVQQQTGTITTSSLNATVQTLTYSYATVNDATSIWLGRWLSIVSALSVALVFASNKDDED